MDSTKKQKSLASLLGTQAKPIDATSIVELGAPDWNYPYPFIITAKQQDVDLISWMKANRQLLDEKLLQFGGVLFRNFPLKNVEAFQQVVQNYSDTQLDYRERTSPRSKVLDKIYTSTDYPADQIINMHNESSYSANWPKQLMFFCNIEPEKDGETPLADSRKLLSLLKPETVKKFRSLGVMYKRKLGTGLGLPWREVFQTNSKAEVETLCKSNGITTRWDNDILQLKWVRPAIHQHPRTGEETWFNHAYFYHPTIAYDKSMLELVNESDLPFVAYYGDESRISDDTIAEIADAYKKTIVMFQWRKGDLLLVDNLLLAHGRNSFRGARQILVAMFDK